MTSTIEWFSLKSFAQLLHLFARHAPHTSAIVRHSRYRMESGDRRLCSRQSLESPISSTELPAGVVLHSRAALLCCRRCGGTRNCDPDTQTPRPCKCRHRPWAPLGTSAPHRRHHRLNAAASSRLRWQRRQTSWPRCLGQQQSSSPPLSVTTFESLDEVAVVEVAAAAQFTTVLEVRIHRIS